MKIDWKEFWEGFLEKCPELFFQKEPTLKSFLKILKPFFDENNAVEVYKYFSMNYPSQKSTFHYNFVNINAKTSDSVFNDYIELIINETEVGNLKKG